jgi:hypothetical protein
MTGFFSRTLPIPRGYRNGRSATMNTMRTANVLNVSMLVVGARSQPYSTARFTVDRGGGAGADQ